MPTILVQHAGETPPDRALTVVEQDRLLTAILSYTDPLELQRVIEIGGLTFDDEINIVIELIKQTEDQRTRLAALKFLDALRMRALRLSGYVVTARQQRKDGPDQVTLSTTRVLRVLERSRNPFSPKAEEQDNGQDAEDRKAIDGEIAGSLPGHSRGPTQALPGGLATGALDPDSGDPSPDD